MSDMGCCVRSVSKNMSVLACWRWVWGPMLGETWVPREGGGVGRNYA